MSKFAYVDATLPNLQENFGIILAKKGLILNEFTANSSGRLDQILAAKMNHSRNQITELIKSGNVYLDGKICKKPATKITPNSKICVNLPTPTPQNEPKYEPNFEVEILYEDDDILVINKPPNVATHPASSLKEASLVEWLNSKNYTLSNISGKIRAGIVHRLDRGTSGALVVAKNNAAHLNLSAQLADKTMGRIYLMLTDLPLKSEIIVNKSIGRNEKNRLKKAILQNGRAAKSAFCNVLTGENTNLVAAKLFTGRTHQIRVHLASINRHIIGDSLYGFKGKMDKISRVFLHAYILKLIHPKNCRKMEFVAPLPSEFYEILAQNFKKEIIDEKIKPNYILDLFSSCSEWMCDKIINSNH